MVTFEQGFEAVEGAAHRAEQAARKLAATARRLRKAAQEGTLSKGRRDAALLAEEVTSVGKTARDAVSSWPFDEAQEPDYLTEWYADELREAATEIGLNVSVRDEALVCSPSIIRVLPAERALRIDGKKRAAIRPSKLAADLHTIQQRMRPKTEAQQQRFLEALYKAFRVICGTRGDTQLEPARVVPLAEVYSVFTSLPGSGSHYTKTDFARDLYLLDSSAVATTRSGARVSFPSSVRRSSGTFSFVDRNGNVIRYYGVQFTE